MTKYVYNGNARIAMAEASNLTAIICLHNTPFGMQVKEIGYSAPQPGFVRKLTSREFVIHFITKGKGYFCGHPIDATRGFLIAPGETFEFYFDESDPWEHYWFRLGGSFVKEQLTALGMNPLHNHVFECNWFSRFIPECHQVIFEEMEGVDLSVWMLGLFYRVMSGFSTCKPQSTDTKSEQYLTMAKSFVEHNFSDPITVGDMARAANITSKYLYRLFSEHLGQSPKAYLISYRLERARDYLHSTRLPVTEIAHMIGYEDPNYFSISFRRAYGMSPLEYRRRTTFPKVN